MNQKHKRRQDMPQRFRLLIVDDDPEIVDLLAPMLDEHGFETIKAHNGAAGLRAAYKHRPDAILLDIMMPDMDGIEVCERLRDMTDVPIIFITAKKSSDDLKKGFAAGGDDYITKPFNAHEVLYRLRAAIRRAGKRSAQFENILFPFDNVMLDGNRHELVVNGEVIHLAPKEFAILHLLMSYTGKMLTPDMILLNVWGSERVGDPNLIKQYIYRLRQKIEDKANIPQLIHTVWGEGYYFDIEPSLESD